MAGAAHLIVYDTGKKLRNDVIAALWTNSAMPPEYIDLVLCRDVFHCTPSALQQENAVDILNALACLEAENKVRKAQEKTAAQKRKR